MFVCALLLEPICFSIILDPFALCDMLIPAGWKPGPPRTQHKEELIDFTAEFTALSMGEREPERSTKPVCLPPAGIVKGPWLCESEG